ncbi:MAG: patatin-like phospholipase family protein [Myxococcales bacterium]|nr:patatin-like phospholipase family protein [Myxococcales bacterium]
MDPQLDASFLRTQPVRQLEQILLRPLSDRPALLNASDTNLLRYGLAVARLTRLRHGSRDHDLFEDIAPFRHWLLEQTSWFIDKRRDVILDWKGLRSLMPAIRSQLDELHRSIAERHAGSFPMDRFESEVTQRELVLVLGGGGGSGYNHLGAFALLNELGITPRLIAGSSMGALLGLFRSVTRSYDPSLIVSALPRPADVGRVFSPYRGFSRFGFPGTVELKARHVGAQIFRETLRTEIPRISELPIAFRPIATGLRTGIGLALSDVESQIQKYSRRPSAFNRTQKASLFSRIVRTMLLNPNFLSEVVFGSDTGLEDFHSVDAVGFSCAVPGIIHYDIHEREDAGIPALNRLFAERQLFRLTDGGVVANVPARIAWRCVERGEIITRNSFILSCDCFAPLVNANLLFYPIQKLARQPVLESIPFSDLHITYRNPPSPVGVLQSREGIELAISRSRAELASEKNYLALVLRRIPRWNQLL